MNMADKFEFGNKDFFRKTLHLMSLAVLQQLILMGINFLDNIMVGGLGESAISAASFGNQFYAVFQFICMGLGSGVVVMTAQFWGSRNRTAMKKVAAIGLRVTFFICAAFTLFSVIAPQVILLIFTADQGVVETGRMYVLLLGLTFIPSGLSSTATYLMRSTDYIKVPLIGSVMAFGLNVFFNWVFIFGMLGAPALGLTGAAVGTVIARVCEFVFVFGFFVFKENDFGFRLKDFRLKDAGLRRQYTRYSVPVIVSDTLLGISLALATVVMGHMGREVSASNAIVTSFVNVLCVLNSGMAGASAVVIGNTIGEGDTERAKREGNTFVVISFIIGFALIPVILLVQGPYFSVYNIGSETLQLAYQMNLVNCFFIPIQTMAYVTSKGILRGGGDTKFLLLADSSMVWFVSLPLGALGAFVWNIPAIWVYVLLRMEFPLKGIICLIRYISGKWIKVVRTG